jgi:hypothetical protein
MFVYLSYCLLFVCFYSFSIRAQHHQMVGGTCVSLGSWFYRGGGFGFLWVPDSFLTGRDLGFCGFRILQRVGAAFLLANSCFIEADSWLLIFIQQPKNKYANQCKTTMKKSQWIKQIPVEPPWNVHQKMQQPGLSQKTFFNAKTDDFSTWLTRSPHFLQRFPRSWFFRESILRGNRQALWIFAIC